jgi:multidrug resistance efflux pump
VLRTFRDEGELCQPGTVVARVIDDRRGRWVYGYVNERDVFKLSPGQEVSVEIASGYGGQVDGKVAEVSMHTEGIDTGLPAGAGGGRSRDMVWVRVTLDEQNPEWRPGMSARAVINVR